MILAIVIAALLLLSAIVLIADGSRRHGGLKHQLREAEKEDAAREGRSEEETP